MEREKEVKEKLKVFFESFRCLKKNEKNMKMRRPRKKCAKRETNLNNEKSQRQEWRQ